MISCSEDKKDEKVIVVVDKEEEFLNLEYKTHINDPLKFTISGDRTEDFQEVRFYSKSGCPRGEEILISSKNELKDGVLLNLGFLFDVNESDIFYSVVASSKSVTCTLLTHVILDTAGFSKSPMFSNFDISIANTIIRGDVIDLKGDLGSLDIEETSKENFHSLNIYSNGEFLSSHLIDDYLSGIKVQIKENTTNVVTMKFSDLAGNESSASEELIFSSDNIKPDSPTVNKYFENGSVTGRRFIIAGIGNPDPDYSLIRVYHNDNLIKELSPDSFYEEGYTHESLLFGIQEFNIVSVDAVGNESSNSYFFVSVESLVPEIPFSSYLIGDSLGNNPNPSMTIVGAEIGSVIGIYSDKFCSQKIGEKLAENISEIIQLTLPSTAQYHFYIKLSKGKFKSICLDTYEEYFYDNKPARFPDSVTKVAPVNDGGSEGSFVFNMTGLDVGDYIYFFNDKLCSNGFIKKELITQSDLSFSIPISEGDNDLSFYVANPIGNTSSCSSYYSYKKDTVAPTAPVINKIFPADAEGKESLLDFKISGLEIGAKLRIYDDACLNVKKEIDIEAEFIIEEIVLTEDKDFFIYADSVDVYGNKSGCVMSPHYVRDTTAPLDPLNFSIISPIGEVSNSTELTFQIDYDEAGLVKIYDTFSCSSVPLKITDQATVDVNDYVTDDGIFRFYLTIEDTLGNVSECLDYDVKYTYDTKLPNFTIESMSDYNYVFNENVSNFLISGLCEDDFPISYNINGIQSSSNCYNGNWGLTLDFTLYAEGEISFLFSQENLAGNKKEINLTLMKDLTAPDFPDAVLDPDWDGSTTDPFIYFTNIEDGATVFLYNNATCDGIPASGVEDNNSLVLRKTDEGAGSYSLAFKVVDTLGNMSECSPSKINFSISNMLHLFYQEIGSLKGIWKRRGSTDTLIVENVKEFILFERQVLYVKNNKIHSYDGQDHTDLNLPSAYYEKLQLYNGNIYYSCFDPILGYELCYFDKDLNVSYMEEIALGDNSGIPDSSFPIIRTFSDNLILVEYYPSIVDGGGLVPNLNITNRLFMNINTSSIHSYLPVVRSVASFNKYVFYITNAFPYVKMRYDLINDVTDVINGQILIQNYYAPSESLLFGDDIFLFYSKGYGATKEFRRYNQTSDSYMFDITHEIDVLDLIRYPSKTYMSMNYISGSFNLYYHVSGVPNVILLYGESIKDVSYLNKDLNDDLIFFGEHSGEFKLMKLNTFSNEIDIISVGYGTADSKVYEYELKK